MLGLLPMLIQLCMVRQEGELLGLLFQQWLWPVELHVELRAELQVELQVELQQCCPPPCCVGCLPCKIDI